MSSSAGFTSKRSAMRFYALSVAALVFIGFMINVGVGILMLMVTGAAVSLGTWSTRVETKPKKAKAPAKPRAKKGVK